MKLNTKLVTGSVIVNYVNITEPRATDLDSQPKYSITIIIPKEASETMGKIYTAMANATKNGLDLWGGQVPDDLITCLKNGDTTGRKEYQGAFYINATSKYKPQLVDKALNPIDPNELYNGCIARISLNFFPYHHKASGNTGIGAELLNIQKIKDGERISNRTQATDDFDIVEDDGILL